MEKKDDGKFNFFGDLWRSFSSQLSPEKNQSSQQTTTTNTKIRNLIVFDGDPTHDWCQIFENCELNDGSKIRVVQASWIQTSATVYADTGCLLTIQPIRESEGKVSRPASLTVKPDFVLVRNQPRGPTPPSDRRQVLYALIFANVPSINSLHSIYMDLERPIMYAMLKEIERKLGSEKFPLIPISYFSSPDDMVVYSEFPCVLKVSHAHAGMGKVLLQNYEQFRDLKTVLALEGQYSTAEPYIPTEYGIRVQKVGDIYRVYRKAHTGSGWKSQFGGADLQDIELTEKYKLWADECSQCFGGLDILAIDAVCGPKGEFIIELNGSAIGIQPRHWVEDSNHLKELVIRKMNIVYA